MQESQKHDSSISNQNHASWNTYIICMEKLATIIGFIISGLIGLWSIWLTWCAFFGGSVWVIFGWWQFEGVDIIRGLLFLFIGEPIILTVAYWVGILIAMPIMLVISLFSTNKKQ